MKEQKIISDGYIQCTFIKYNTYVHIEVLNLILFDIWEFDYDSISTISKSTNMQFNMTPDIFFKLIPDKYEDIVNHNLIFLLPKLFNIEISITIMFKIGSLCCDTKLLKLHKKNITEDERMIKQNNILLDASNNHRIKILEANFQTMFLKFDCMMIAYDITKNKLYRLESKVAELESENKNLSAEITNLVKNID